MATKKNSAAVQLGRRGGKKRAENLSSEELSAQGRKAVMARWARAAANSPEQRSEIARKAAAKSAEVRSKKAAAKKKATAKKATALQKHMEGAPASDQVKAD